MNFRDAIISPDASIHQAIECIESNAAKIALVVDGGDRLIGTVTDGDIRRGILRSISLQASVQEIMNAKPRTSLQTDDKTALLAMMRRELYKHIPLVDAENRLVDLVSLNELFRLQERKNCVILMAGGEGQRLRPLTENTPKPLLWVGPKPILATIIDSFVAAGFTRFYISVNYLADRVQEYFGDGRSRGIEITYLRETQRLGTAGALALLEERPSEPFFVMNSDILTNIDFRDLLEFHRDHDAMATMCVREHVMQIPYGVVDLDGHRLSDIQEKPVVRRFVNAGIYVLDPDVLEHVPPQQAIGMPELFNKLRTAGHECVAFPVREYWIDVGHPEDYTRANVDFDKVFR